MKLKKFEVEAIQSWTNLQLKKFEVKEIKLKKFKIEEIWSWNMEVEGQNIKNNNFTFDKKIQVWPESTITDGRPAGQRNWE